MCSKGVYINNDADSSITAVCLELDADSSRTVLLGTQKQILRELFLVETQQIDNFLRNLKNCFCLGLTKLTFFYV